MMNEEYDASEQTAATQEPSLSAFAKSMIATLLLACVVAGGLYATSHNVVQRNADGSTATSADAETFHELDASNLSEVAPADIDRALQTMALSSTDLQSIKTALQLDDAGAPQAHGEKDASQQTQAQSSRQKTRLMWITLWDAGAQEGDVVRIDSEGYSRTVLLTTEEQTFAVPVSPNGHVRITDVKDGDAVGMTVGVASRTTRATFRLTARTK
jgi:hypothetical protein